MQLRIVLILFALLVVGESNSATAQRPDIPWYRKAHSWSLYEENDTFGSSDSSYTQGIRVGWNYSTWNRNWNASFAVASLVILVKPLFPRIALLRECADSDALSDKRCGGVLFGIGQTMYTPSDLKIPALQLNQRPYAGYLSANFGMTARYPNGAVTTQVMLGTTGPRSLAREAQSLAHWTLSTGSPQPQGWHNQLNNAWQFALVNQYSGRARNRWMEKCSGACGLQGERRVYDLTPRLELNLGTPMTRASTGGVLRVGYGFPNNLNPDRIPTTRFQFDGSRSLCQTIADLKPWVMVFGTVDGRVVAWNQLLSGTYADDHVNGWRSVKEIETNRLNWERSYGVAVGSNLATIVFQRVTRGKEYHPHGGSHRYGSITFTVHSARSESIN